MPRKRKNPLDWFLRAAKEPTDTLFISDGGLLDLKAGGDDDAPKRFDAVAYGGGVIRAKGMGGPVVVDLKGVTIVDGTRPILRDHDDTKVVGHSENIQVNPTSGITAQGLVSGAGEAATEVLTASRNGFPWKMSIGARISNVQRIAPGASVRVNGRNFVGPIGVVRKAQVYELSIVSLPGDSETSVSIAASLSAKDTDMEFNDWLTAKGFDPETIVEQQEKFLRASYDTEMALKAKAADEALAPKKKTIKKDLLAAGDFEEDVTGCIDPTAELRATHSAEIKRLGQIATVCKEHPDLHAKAAEEGWDVTKTELEVLKAGLDAAPTFHVRKDAQQPNDVLEAALCVAGGLQDVEKQYSDETLQAAHTTFGGGIGLQELILNAAHANGFTGRASFKGNYRDVLQAAFSTTSLPGILSNTANKFLLAGFNSVEDVWRSISAIGSVSDFKQVTRYRLTGDLTYDQLAPTGEIKHGQVSEESFTNQALTYAKMMGVSRVDIINDDLGALNAIPMKLGVGAGRKVNNVFWTAFMDNASFFAAGNNNYMSGATTNLSITSLTAAELLFLNQVDADDQPLGLDPAILLVPNALFTGATQLMHDLEVRDEAAGAGTAKYLTGNPHAGKFQVKKSSYLHNSGYTGYSTKAWFLLANPGQLATIEMVFLNGKQVPTVETADADFNTLGIQMRGYHDFGVNKQETRAGIKSKGEA